MQVSVRRHVWIKKLASLPLTIKLYVIFIIFMLLMLFKEPQLMIKAKFTIFGSEIDCFRDHGMNTLPDILEETSVPTNAIFFHETSCGSSQAGRILITGRQACAVESAALLHPNRKVYMLFTSPGTIIPGIGDDSDLALNALQSYENVNLGHVNFPKYINNTPLEHLYSSGKIEMSYYAGSHASDILRYLTLWRYGGVYLDLDVVITKNLDELGENYAGSESKTNVAAGVIGLGSNGLGHTWASSCLDDLSKSFNGFNWGHNGPGVITRLLQKLCGVAEAYDMLNNNCGGFQVMPPNAFYPIAWWNWTLYFDPLLADRTLAVVESSYAIHVWNKHSSRTKVWKDSAYARVAQKFCPKVYKALENSYF